MKKFAAAIKRLIATAFVLVFFAPSVFAGEKTVNVRGYTRKDGTVVAPYTRSAPSASTTLSAPATTSPSVTYSPAATYTAPVVAAPQPVPAPAPVITGAILKCVDAAGNLSFTNVPECPPGYTVFAKEAATAATKLSPMPAPNSSFTSDADLAWLASSLTNDYRGKIGKVEKLTSSTCWAILEPGMTVPEVMKTTGLICEYIRNASGRKVQPNVHTFQGMTHMAVAKPPDCKPELKIEKW